MADDEREDLYERLIDAAERALTHQADPGTDLYSDAQAAVTAVLRQLRVLSVREAAVLLGEHRG